MTVRLFKLLRLAALCGVGLSLSSVAADEILVITRPETTLKDMSAKRLENIFLRKTLLNDSGSRWIPLNLSPEHPLRQAFSQSLFKKRPEALEAYWNEQYFQGITPPYVVASEEAMLRFVSSTPGAIGYILPCHLDARVQVVFKLLASTPIEQHCDKHAR
ncbi:MAG: hypothetical protein Q7U57_11585 [Methylovulum sp.]|nr:hypothetical protein [Methylovulum sp.]